MPKSGDQRGYVAGNFFLELDGMRSGWLTSAEGGLATTEVVMEKIGPDHLQHKHLSGLKYEDLTLTFGTGMSRKFWDWIQRSFDRNYKRYHGAVVAANYDYKETSRLEFYQALVSELAFPGLDASSRESCRVTAKITPERTTFAATPKGGANIPFKGDPGKQHMWSQANFRLNIDNLDCSRVFKIEPITLRQKLTDYAVGESRHYEKEPVQVEYSDLSVTVPESHSVKFWKWYEDFVVGGQCTEKGERTGTLEYLNPALNKVLFTLTFHGLGIYKATPDKMEGGSEAIRRVKFDMYCEKIDFKYSDDAVFG